MKVGRIAAALLAMLAPALADAPAAMIAPQAMKITNDGPITEYDTAMTPSDVIAFYRKSLPSDGWSLTDDVRSPAAISFFFSRGANAEGSVVITVRGNRTHVVLKVTE
jgi:hypothetical protein